jgi:hypothetical protein
MLDGFTPEPSGEETPFEVMSGLRSHFFYL